jgi:protease IV
MKTFFKTFLACLLALIIFTVIAIVFMVSTVKNLAEKDKTVVAEASILVLDLGQHYREQVVDNIFSGIINDPERDVPGLYDVIRIIQTAKTDNRISGIYIQANPGSNGFAAAEEIRNALADFKQSGKFIIAHADVITQRSYYIANIADKVYLSPQGFFEWFGYSVDYAFLKGTLEKLDIEPQIFYAGKFKSATEPLRADRMTEENRLQTTVWMNDLYNDLLVKTAQSRKLDTAALRQWANSGVITTAQAAMDYKLIDSLKYDDEVRDEFKRRLNIGKFEKTNFITVNSYREATKYIKTGGDKIALIYAEGDIIDGEGGQGTIASDDYRSLLRKARLDRSVKAIVFRINSGGGSSMASENIWRELALAKKEKPVVVSFGDVAASGGYYIAAAADSIFAQPTTITGSIGVFGIIPNMQEFFKNKLGITFDGVKTGPYADMMTITRPMTAAEKKIIQDEIENIYSLFKRRVAEGRKKDTAYIDSIAQGRVWTGQRALEIGLIDRFGGLDAAVQSAAKMAKLTDYHVREYPETETMFEQIFGKTTPVSYQEMLKKEMGEENYKLYEQVKKVKEMTNRVQARLPFEFFIR